MWLGERITDKGIGNGISMLIMIGIVSRLPLSLVSEVTDKFPGKAIFFIVELFVLFAIVVARDCADTSDASNSNSICQAGYRK